MTQAPLPGGPFVIMGLARSGLAAALQLLKRGVPVRVTDLKPARELAAEVDSLQAAADRSGARLEIHLGAHPEAMLQGAAALILSPGIPPEAPYVRQAAAAGLPVWSEVELAYRLLQGTVAGITGSNGKSTTTALTAHILEQAGRVAFAAGNIGRAMSDFLAQDGPEAIFVTELSSFQLETIDRFHPKIAAFLNFTPDHLDRYPSLEAYAEAKWNLFRNMTAGDAAVLNGNDPALRRQAARILCPVYFFDSRPVSEPDAIHGAGIVQDTLWLRTSGAPIRLLARGEIPVPGRHNLENALAAALMCHLLGLDAAKIAAGIRSYRPLPHRLQFVAEVAGRSFYNDSKATNVDSTLLAIQSFEQPIVLILGGKDKGSPYTPLLETMRRRVRHCLVIGQATSKIEQELGHQVAMTRCRDLAEAVGRSLEFSQPGDVVLLSPACASYDQFRDYEQRGEVFVQSVRRLRLERGGL